MIDCSESDNMEGWINQTLKIGLEGWKSYQNRFLKMQYHALYLLIFVFSSSLLIYCKKI